MLETANKILDFDLLDFWPVMGCSVSDSEFEGFVIWRFGHLFMVYSTYIHIYICVCAGNGTSMCAYIHSYIPTYPPTYLYIPTHMHTYLLNYLHSRIVKYIHAYIHTYIFFCLLMYVCMICMYVVKARCTLRAQRTCVAISI